VRLQRPLPRSTGSTSQRGLIPAPISTSALQDSPEPFRARTCCGNDLGHLKNQMNQNSTRAFTLIELLVVIAIIAILAAILFPVFAQAKAAAKKSADVSNLKQLGLAFHLYSNDFDDMAVPSGMIGYLVEEKKYFWYGSISGDLMTATNFVNPKESPLYPYQKNVDVMGDPTAKGIPQVGAFGHTDYGYNYLYVGGYGDFYGQGPQAYLSAYTYAPKSLTSFARPSDTLGFTNSAYADSIVPTPLQKYAWLTPASFGDLFGDEFCETTHGRHTGGSANVLWLDSHVKSVKPVVRSSGAARKQLNIGYVMKGQTTNDYYYGGPEEQP
jgi:prepilin-type N-terminal cleavage/methylation domain-containing protein/prepilin-type processing-associated H-X9-DG protein